MSEEKGSSDEAIGRPGEWREGRYERAGKPVDASVVKPVHEEDASEVESTPVTRKDYESLDKPE